MLRWLAPSLLLLFLAAPSAVVAFSSPNAVPSLRSANAHTLVCSAKDQPAFSRRSLLSGGAAFGLALGTAGGKVGAEESKEKLIGLSNAELAKKVEFDVKERQFMVTGDLTRALYDESCTFTDEIDTYTLDKWMDGTSKLFRNDYSRMELDGPVSVTDAEIKFRFKEQLMFNIPILLPKVPLTGELTLKRGSNGLFTRSYDPPTT